MRAPARAIRLPPNRHSGAIVWMLRACAIDPPQVCRWILRHSMRAMG
jgi:hypothetical protein